MLFCWHKWETREVMRYRLMGLLWVGSATDILLKCVKCGKYKVKTVWGHWSLESMKDGKNEGL